MRAQPARARARSAHPASGAAAAREPPEPAGGTLMAESILESRELHAYYGASHILHGIDFRIDRGETVGLMGRNGMGKTHADPQHAGHRQAAPRRGVRLRHADDGRRSRFSSRAPGIAYVPEGRGIFPNLTVRENLVMAARAGAGRPPRLDVRARDADVSPPRRAARPRRLAALGRRAADADDRPRADDQSRPPDPRRGDRGPRAADREGDLAHRRRDPRARHRRADRRQELQGGHARSPAAT